MLYPAGWGSKKVVDYCGPDASPYKVGLCSLGWAFYTAIGGTVLTFICAMFSAQAEIATSSDKVQDEIEEGRSLICVLWDVNTNHSNHLCPMFTDWNNWCINGNVFQTCRSTDQRLYKCICFCLLTLISSYRCIASANICIKIISMKIPYWN